MKCEGKKSYSDEIAADIALIAIQQVGRVRDKTPTRSYKCNLCGKYHLTSQVLNKYK